jgi:tRNA threonylcarbamoyladenosine biosynthesis protein TsaE
MREILLLEKESRNKNETRAFAAESVRYIQRGDTVLLYGDLGSGKTFLTREYVKLLGNTAPVSSPSFTIINRYEGSNSINHIDLYRIKDRNELSNIGIEDLWESDSINFIEWPKLLENQIDWDHFRLFIQFSENKKFWRHLKFIHYVTE